MITFRLTGSTMVWCIVMGFHIEHPWYDTMVAWIDSGITTKCLKRSRLREHISMDSVRVNWCAVSNSLLTPILTEKSALKW
jgi:hypothetical protein